MKGTPNHSFYIITFSVYPFWDFFSWAQRAILSYNSLKSSETFYSPEKLVKDDLYTFSVLHFSAGKAAQNLPRRQHEVVLPTSFVHTRWIFSDRPRYGSRTLKMWLLPDFYLVKIICICSFFGCHSLFNLSWVCGDWRKHHEYHLHLFQEEPQEVTVLCWSESVLLY